MNVAEIKELKTYLTTQYHNNRIKQQQDDENFVNDSIDISYLPSEVSAMQTGKAYRMVEAPAEHIITSNPQLFRTPVKNTDVEASHRIAQEGNRWLQILSHQTVNPFKTHVKYLLGQGEAWIYLVPNDDYDKDNPLDLPVHFMMIPPQVVFVDGWAGENNGVPRRLIVCYDRIAENIKRNYPGWKWKNQQAGKISNDKVPYFMYIDDNIRYIEADDEALLVDEKGEPYNGDGIQENFYKSTNFVHSYAGFGKPSADGDPASLCISRITNCRDLIREYTAIRSVINYLIFQYAQPPTDYEYDPTAFTPPPGFADKYDRSPKALNMVPVTPGSKGMVKGVDKLPDAQLFQHLYNIEKQIDEEDPLGQVGQVVGSSGRQQIDAKEASLRRYDTVVENTAHAFETAFGLAFQMCDMRPSLYPQGLHKGDLKDNYTFRIELKAEDPLEAQITRSDGDRKYTNGIIDWETNLTEYQGYTQDQAQKIMDKRIVDDFIMNDPILRMAMGQQIAQEMGILQQYEQAKQMAEQTGKGISSAPQIGSRGGEPRQGNIKTQTGMEMQDMSLSQRPIRRSPMP